MVKITKGKNGCLDSRNTRPQGSILRSQEFQFCAVGQHAVCTLLRTAACAVCSGRAGSPKVCHGQQSKT